MDIDFQAAFQRHRDSLGNPASRWVVRTSAPVGNFNIRTRVREAILRAIDDDTDEGDGHAE